MFRINRSKNYFSTINVPLTFYFLFLFAVTSSIGQSVSSFTLIDAQSDVDIGPLVDGTSIVLADLPSTQLNVRANTTGEIGSVVFMLNGVKNQTENVSPYALFGDQNSNYYSWTPLLESYTIEASVFSQKNGNGDLIDNLEITVTFTDQEPEINIPEAPTNLAGTSVIPNQINLTWEDNADDEAGFLLEYRPQNFSNIQWQSLASLPSNTTTYQHGQLDNNEYNFYRIKSFNSAGESEFTAETEVANFPSPPSNFVVSNISETSFDLAWTESPYGNDYLIESANSEAGPWTFFDALYYGYTDFTYSGLEPNTTYFLRMRTNFGNLNSEWSPIFSVTTLPQSIEVGPDVLSLTLVNADTDQDIKVIEEGDVFNLIDIGTDHLNVRAEVANGTESVVFGYNGNSSFSVENVPVYAIGGNTGNDYKPWIPEIGANILTATAYSANNASGLTGNPLTLNFTIINEEDDPELPVIVRINAGGEAIAYNDTTYIADDYFAGNGKSYPNNSITDILNTSQDEIYKTERSALADLQSFSYNIPISNGTYEINLHFAEIYFGATGGGPGGEGKRVFTVEIEGEEVLVNFDINSEVSPMTAVIKAFSTNVTDEELNIIFSASVNQPKISAIEVYSDGQLLDPGNNDCVWTNLANSSLSKVEAQSVKVDDKLYVLAGFLAGLKITGATEIYEPSSDTWTNGAPMPSPVTHMGAVAVGDEIWIVAGFEGNHPGVATDKVQIYNTVSDSWSVGPALPNPRGSGAAVYSDGKIHFFGGLLPDRRTDVGEHFILDVNNQSAGWIAAASLPNPRNHLSGAAVDGIIYAIGGQYGHDNGVQDQNFVDAYDPETDSWTRVQGMSSARSHFEPGTFVHNEKIIIVGGRRGSFFFDTVSEYDPTTDTWTDLCELPSKLLAPAAKAFGDKLIVANGGENGTCCPKSATLSLPIEAEIVDPGPDDEGTVSGELRKWHKVTVAFEGPELSENSSANPFTDYRLNVTFTNGSNSITVPGYYAADGNAENSGATSGNKWNVHFSPDNTGTWTYTASFRTGSNVALSTNPNAGNPVGFNGATGDFQVENSNKSGRDFRGKGRLEYVGEHYLRFRENGEYFLKAGADAPENTFAYEDFDATPNKGGRRKSWQPHAGDFSLADAGEYTWGSNAGDGGRENGREMLGMLKYLSDQGMNVFSFLTFSLNGDDGNVYPHAQKTANATDWSNVEHLRFDVSKLAQWEKILEYADKKGIFIHFKTQETENDQRMDGGLLGNERKLYYRELIARFGHHLALNWNLGEENDIWTELNDPDNNNVKDYAQYIKDVDPYDHHIVIHTYPGQQDEVYNTLLGNQSQLTGPSIQASGNNIHNNVKEWVEESKNAGKKWVVCNDEQGSANIGVAVDASFPDSQLPESRNEADNREAVRAQVLWGTLMAGGAGVEYYYGYQTGCDDLDCQNHRTRESKWKDARNALAFFNENLQTYLSDMVSADNLTSSNSDYVLTDNDEVYVVYLPSGGSTSIDLGSSTSQYTIKWYDPRNGGSLQDGSITTVDASSNVNIGSPPNSASEDWTVFLKKSGTVTTNDFNVLIYHETSGFRHGSIGSGISMIENFGIEEDWTVDNSQTSDVFTSANLANYDVVVWLNTSGNGLLTGAEQDAFEGFIQSGGGFVGVHAATDTYRDRSWPWYNDLVGGIVQTSPNHTPNNTNGTMDVVGDHPTVDHLGATWNKSEEYYYWELNGGYLSNDNIDLLRVRSTGSNSYDAVRPITWYKNYDGGRSFYTALGHNSSDYSNNQEFITMVKEAIIWTGNSTDQLNNQLTNNRSAESTFKIYPNPALDRITIDTELRDDQQMYDMQIFSLDGKVVRTEKVAPGKQSIVVSGMLPGNYLVVVKGADIVWQKQLILIR